MLSGVLCFDMLRYLATELEPYMPSAPDEKSLDKPWDYHASDLLSYVSGSLGKFSTELECYMPPVPDRVAKGLPCQ